MRSIVVLIALVLVVAGLGYSVWRGAPDTVRSLSAEYERFEPMRRAEREQAFIALLPMPVDVFAWYADQLRPGDRYYVHGAPGGFGAFADLRQTVRNVGRLYFVPAVEVDRPEDANVIVTWGVDPAELGFEYCHQVRAGLQPYFVSRVRCGG